MTTEWIVNVPGGDWSDPVFGLTAPAKKKRTTRVWGFALLALLVLAGAKLVMVPSQPEVKHAVKPAPRPEPSLVPVVRSAAVLPAQKTSGVPSQQAATVVPAQKTATVVLAQQAATVVPPQKTATVVRARTPSTRPATAFRGKGPVE